MCLRNAFIKALLCAAPFGCYQPNYLIRILLMGTMVLVARTNYHYRDVKEGISWQDQLCLPVPCILNQWTR